MKKLVILSAFLSLFFIIPASAAEFNVNLKYGSKGADVIKLQEFLVEQDLYNGPVTGNFFSLTLKAVKSFQVREAISPASGFFGSLTRAKVNTLLDAQLAGSESDSLADPAGPVVIEANPVSPEVLRMNELMGAIQSQTVSTNQQLAAIQEQNQILQGNLALQQAAAAAEAERLRVAEQARLDLEARNAAVLERSEQPGASTYTPDISEKIRSKYFGIGVGPDVLLSKDTGINSIEVPGQPNIVTRWVSFSRRGPLNNFGAGRVFFGSDFILDRNGTYCQDLCSSVEGRTNDMISFFGLEIGKEYKFRIVDTISGYGDVTYEGTI